MEIYHWIGDHGFSLLEAIGIICSLTFTGAAFCRDHRSRRIENLLNLTQNHREIWKELLRDQRLRRILDATVDPGPEPITREEEIFVTLVVQHLNFVFYAIRDELTIDPSGLRRDVRQFFSLPIPKRVWDELKGLQNREFVEFVEECLR